MSTERSSVFTPPAMPFGGWNAQQNRLRHPAGHLSTFRANRDEQNGSAHKGHSLRYSVERREIVTPRNVCHGSGPAEYDARRDRSSQWMAAKALLCVERIQRTHLSRNFLG